MKISNCQNAFHKDGSLRDIYVYGVTTEHWDRFLNLVRSSAFGLCYFRNGEVAQLPSTAAQILGDRSCSHNLAIDLGGVEACCHFFAEDEIELDIDPRDVKSATTEERVLDFMEQLGAHLDLDVILTEENSPKEVWFRYSSREGVVRCEHTV